MTTREDQERPAKILEQLAENPALLEIGRRAIENTLVDWRDNRLSEFPQRGNGFTIKEKDGSDSIIRFGPETGLRIALLAIANHLKAQNSCPDCSRFS